MTGKSRSLKEATLPSNPKWVVIEASDGDPSRWPTNTVENPDSEGHVNFMQPVSVDDGVAVKWRIVIGQALAEMLKYPDIESRSWVLKDWPYGYHFYDHNKGQLGGKVRHDLYLVGSVHAPRFRSPQEFIPHAYWLMTDTSQNRSRCECKYCAGKPQREISDAMGLSQRQGGSPSLARFAELPRREKRRRILPVREGRVFAAVRKAPNPIRLPKGPIQHANPEREKDLRALLGPKSLGERRWAREGELVWVKLDYPISVDDRSPASEQITFWPGMIEEVNFKAEVTLKPSHNSTNGDGNPSSSKVDDTDPWTIVHKSVYTINLLVVSKTVMYGSDHILPYQSDAPDHDLILGLKSIIFDLGPDPNENKGEDGTILAYDSQPQSERAEQALFKRFQAFDPFPPSRPSFARAEDRTFYLDTAAGAFSTAIQIAARLTEFWTPTDEWEYKLQMNPGAFERSDVTSTSNGIFTPAEGQGQRSLGTQSLSFGAVETQLRFQGLWWGGERIWMGDLVRLKLGRYQLAPEGTDTIKKPSGAGRRELAESSNGLRSSHPPAHVDAHVNGVEEMSTEDGEVTEVQAQIREEIPTEEGEVVEVRDENGDSKAQIREQISTEESDVMEVHAEADDNSRNYGAWPRSLFLRLDGLFVVQVPSEDGQGNQNECRMCGMLFELADDDWEPEGEEFGQVEPQGDVTTLNGASVNQSRRESSGGVIPTPIRAVMPNQGGVASTNGTNDSSTDLFTPNPELLFEPPNQADIVMADGTVNRPPSILQNGNGHATEQVILPVPSEPKTESGVPPNPSLSGPLKSAVNIYPTPPAPHSLKFRPILRNGHEIIMPLTTLAGRYYPSLLSNTLLQSRVLAALENPDARESKAIRALEGLVPGVYNSVDASKFVPRRGQMLREAESVAWSQVVGHWRGHVARMRNTIVIDDDV